MIKLQSAALRRSGRLRCPNRVRSGRAANTTTRPRTRETAKPIRSPAFRPFAALAPPVPYFPGYSYTPRPLLTPMRPAVTSCFSSGHAR